MIEPPLPDRSPIPHVSACEDPIDHLIREGVLNPPSRVGYRAAFQRFLIVKSLGKGGLGIVLLGYDPEAQDFVAIKLLKPEYVHQVEHVELFRGEIRILQRLSKLNHPHILPVIETSEAEQCPFIVMPYMEKGALAERNSEDRLIEDEAVKIGLAISSALSVAHRQVIYHRDLKPENVLIAANGTPYLADFNLALDGTSPNNLFGEEGRIVGTAPYLAPEVASGVQLADSRSDIYGLGSLLYFMITGCPPHVGDSDFAIIHSICAGKPVTPVSTITPNSSPKLIRVIDKAMQRNPNKRYSDMAELVEDLELISLGNEPRHARRNTFNQTTNWLIVMLTLSLIAFSIITAWSFWHRNDFTPKADNSSVTAATLSKDKQKTPDSAIPHLPLNRSKTIVSVTPNATKPLKNSSLTIAPYSESDVKLLARNIAKSLKSHQIHELEIRDIPRAPNQAIEFKNQLEVALKDELNKKTIHISLNAPQCTYAWFTKSSYRSPDGVDAALQFNLEVIDQPNKVSYLFTKVWTGLSSNNKNNLSDITESNSHTNSPGYEVLVDLKENGKYTRGSTHRKKETAERKVDYWKSQGKDSYYRPELPNKQSKSTLKNKR